MTLRLLDTFSGIGGFSYAAERIVGGFETVAFVERELYCQRILGKHWPNVPIHDDITTFNPEPYSADVVCGGFPCQDISLAGKQAGIKEGTRSGLFYELMRVVRLVRPQYVVLENVSAILANGLDTVLGTLAEAGFDAEWACIPASAVGACHQRDRWWLVAYPKGSGARQYEPQSRRQCNGEDLLANGCANKEISQHFANPSSERLERPQHSEWRAAEQLCPNWGGYISKPVLCRGDDGLSNRVDRLKALGNAVVPQVAAIPLARVRQLAGV
ncbi:DNA-cytosine methyltransferase [Synechococcus phage S-H1]|nr:DNA-cytosine methyltransferase [Synechococcus phage S-H1]